MNRNPTSKKQQKTTLPPERVKDKIASPRAASLAAPTAEDPGDPSASGPVSAVVEDKTNMLILDEKDLTIDMAVNTVWIKIREHVQGDKGKVTKFFYELDTNHDKTITASELKAALAKLNVSVTENIANAAIKAADANGDGDMDLQEMLAMISKREIVISKTATVLDLKSIFKDTYPDVVKSLRWDKTDFAVSDCGQMTHAYLDEASVVGERERSAQFLLQTPKFQAERKRVGGGYRNKALINGKYYEQSFVDKHFPHKRVYLNLIVKHTEEEAVAARAGDQEQGPSDFKPSDFKEASLPQDIAFLQDQVDDAEAMANDFEKMVRSLEEDLMTAKKKEGELLGTVDALRNELAQTELKLQSALATAEARMVRISELQDSTQQHETTEAREKREAEAKAQDILNQKTAQVAKLEKDLKDAAFKAQEEAAAMGAAHAKVLKDLEESHANTLKSNRESERNQNRAFKDRIVSEQQHLHGEQINILKSEMETAEKAQEQLKVDLEIVTRELAAARVNAKATKDQMQDLVDIAKKEQLALEEKLAIKSKYFSSAANERRGSTKKETGSLFQDHCFKEEGRQVHVFDFLLTHHPEYFKIGSIGRNFVDKALKNTGVGIEWHAPSTVATALPEIMKDPELHTIWIISGKDSGHLSPENAKLIADFHRAGGGIALWGDNDPFFVEANLVMNELGWGEMVGDYIGMQVVGPASKPGESGFNARHPILFGIDKLYEGNTVAGIIMKEAALSQGWMEIMRATDKRLLTAYLPPRGEAGPAILHGAYTQLFSDSKVQGQEPFVTNLGIYSVLRSDDVDEEANMPVSELELSLTACLKASKKKLKALKKTHSRCEGALKDRVDELKASHAKEKQAAAKALLENEKCRTEEKNANAFFVQSLRDEAETAKKDASTKHKEELAKVKADSDKLLADAQVHHNIEAKRVAELQVKAETVQSMAALAKKEEAQILDAAKVDVDSAKKATQAIEAKLQKPQEQIEAERDKAEKAVAAAVTAAKEKAEAEARAVRIQQKESLTNKELDQAREAVAAVTARAKAEAEASAMRIQVLQRESNKLLDAERELRDKVAAAAKAAADAAARTELKFMLSMSTNDKPIGTASENTGNWLAVLAVVQTAAATSSLRGLSAWWTAFATSLSWVNLHVRIGALTEAFGVKDCASGEIFVGNLGAVIAVAALFGAARTATFLHRACALRREEGGSSLLPCSSMPPPVLPGAQLPNPALVAALAFGFGLALSSAAVLFEGCGGCGLEAVALLTFAGLAVASRGLGLALDGGLTVAAGPQRALSSATFVIDDTFDAIKAQASCKERAVFWVEALGGAGSRTVGRWQASGVGSEKADVDTAFMATWGASFVRFTPRWRLFHAQDGARRLALALALGLSARSTSAASDGGAFGWFGVIAPGTAAASGRAQALACATVAAAWALGMVAKGEPPCARVASSRAEAALALGLLLAFATHAIEVAFLQGGTVSTAVLALALGLGLALTMASALTNKDDGEARLASRATTSTHSGGLKQPSNATKEARRLEGVVGGGVPKHSTASDTKKGFVAKQIPPIKMVAAGSVAAMASLDLDDSSSDFGVKMRVSVSVDKEAQKYYIEVQDDLPIEEAMEMIDEEISEGTLDEVKGAAIKARLMELQKQVGEEKKDVNEGFVAKQTLPIKKGAAGTDVAIEASLDLDNSSEFCMEMRVSVSVDKEAQKYYIEVQDDLPIDEAMEMIDEEISEGAFDEVKGAAIKTRLKELQKQGGEKTKDAKIEEGDQAENAVIKLKSKREVKGTSL